MSRLAGAIFAGLIAFGLSGAASAQDAAETAQILGTTGQSQVSAGRSLAKAISHGMNAAGDAINSRPHANHAASRHRRGNARATYALPANVDPLANMDAPVYRLANGTTIEVSGGLIPAQDTTCLKNCPENQDH